MLYRNRAKADQELGDGEAEDVVEGNAGILHLAEATRPSNTRVSAGSTAGQLPGEAVSPETVVTNAAIYWFTNTAASSARFYYEDAPAEHPKEPTTVPIGLGQLRLDFRPLRRLAERDLKNIVS